MKPGNRREFVTGLGVFLLGLSSPFFVNLGGQLYIAEIAVIVLLPFFFLLKESENSREIRILTALSSLWIIGLVVACLVNQSNFEVTLKVAISIVVYCLTCIFFYTAIKTQSHYKVLLTGLAIGQLLAIRIQPDPQFSEAPWKFGLAVPLTLLGLVIASTSTKILAKIIFSVFLGLINLFEDYRSLSLVVFVGFATFLGANRFMKAAKPKTALISIALFSLVSLGVAITYVYTFWTQAGYLGAQASVRLGLQGGGKSPLLMLLGGRNEIFFSLPSAIQNPIFGYGASGQLTPDILASGVSSLNDLGLVTIGDLAKQNEGLGNIPTHSFIMDAWVKAGLLGLVFWLGIGTRIIRKFFERVFEDTDALLSSFLLLFTLWNIAYSPFGGTSRFLGAVCVCYLTSNYETKKVKHD